MMIRFTINDSCLGQVLMAATVDGVCAIYLGDSPDALLEQLHRQFPDAHVQAAGSEFSDWAEQVTAFIEQPARGLKLPLDIQGTAFQQQVWQALQTIPPGATASYTEIAAKIGKPGAVRAVAQACAANPLAVAIPCHRVVRRDGGISGYRWHPERKRALLEREAAWRAEDESVGSV